MSAFRSATRQARSLCASQRLAASTLASRSTLVAASANGLPRSLNGGASLRWYSAEPSKESEAKKEENASTDASAKEAESARKAAEEQHAKALEAKDGEISKLKEGLMKTLADFENLQKTTSRELSNAKEFGISKFAGELINSVDVLELAIQSALKQKEAPAEGDRTNDFNSLLEGVQMTHGNLEKTLARHGVTKFDPTGEKFDPNKHEALFMVPTSATGPDGPKESGVVMNTQKTGWMHKSRVLRAAQVGVTQ